MTFDDITRFSINDPDILMFRADGAVIARFGSAFRPHDRNVGKLALILTSNAGSTVTRGEAIEFLWGHRDDGGPLNAYGRLDMLWGSTRDILSAFGWGVSRWARVGFTAWPIIRNVDVETDRELELT